MSTLTSYESLIREKYYNPELAYYVVPGSLPYYDFKDMDSFLPESFVKITNPVNALGETKTASFDHKEIINFFEREK